MAQQNSQICQIYPRTGIIVKIYNSINDIVKEFPDVIEKYLKEGINKCLKGDNKTSRDFKWMYKSEYDKLNPSKKNIIRPNTKLLIDHYPKLCKEWDYDKNKDYDIKTIPSCSLTKVYWICTDPHKHHPSYPTSINSRTQKDSGCPECAIDNNRVHNKEEKEDHIKNYVSHIKTHEIGDETVGYIIKLLENSCKFIEIEDIGSTGDIADIKITIDLNTIRRIQVKTLVCDKTRIKSYTVLIDHKYPDELLIVMVDKDKMFFALEFAKNIKTRSLRLNFNISDSKYKKIMYRDEKEFLSEMIKMIPKSMEYKDAIILSDTINKEYKSLKRLEDWCTNNGLRFRRNKASATKIDCYINNMRIQAKYKEKNRIKGNIRKLVYNLNISKSCGRYNGLEIKIPYSIDDNFDFLVIEVGGTYENPELYKGNFCFIPRQVLIDDGFLSSPECKGHTKITICPPVYEKTHRYKQYWLPKLLNNEQKKVFWKRRITTIKGVPENINMTLLNSPKTKHS